MTLSCCVASRTGRLHQRSHATFCPLQMKSAFHFKEMKRERPGIGPLPTGCEVQALINGRAPPAPDPALGSPR